MPSVTTHSSTAHNASAAHKLRSATPASGGSADAAADLSGNDPFAALLAEVAPSAAAPKTAGQGTQKGADKKNTDPNASDSSANDAAQASAKSTGVKDAAPTGTASSTSARQDAATSTDPSQSDPSQIALPQDPAPQDASSQSDPSQIDPSRIATTNAGKGASEKTVDPSENAADPSAVTPGKSKDKAAAHHTIVDAKTDTKTVTKDNTGTTNAAVQPDAGSVIKPITKEDGKAGKDSDAKKIGKKADAKTDPNLTANAALLPMPAPATASFQPITLTLSMSGASGHADDSAQDDASPAGVTATGTTSGQDGAKAKKPQTPANQTDLTDPNDQRTMSDVADAAQKAGKTTDLSTDKKNTKPDPKQAGPQTATKLNPDPGAVLLKQPSRNDANSTPSSASQSAGSNAGASANAPQSAAPQAAAPQIALTTLSPAPTGGPAPLPGIPTPTQLPGAAAPQSAQNTSATLQTAPQTPNAITPNLNLFALNIATRAQNGLKQFDITMTPAELGQVNVSLSIDKTGKTEAHLSAERPQTLALLQQNSSGLRIALRDAGLNLAQNGLNFSLNGQNSQQQNQSKTAPGARGRALSLRAVAAVGAAQNVLPAFSSTGVNTRLDIHV